MKPFYTTKLALLIAILLGLNFTGTAQTYTFAYTGGQQTFYIPAGITALSIDMVGADGGSDYVSGYGNRGVGARIQCIVPVSAFSVNPTLGGAVWINVGGVGSNGTSSYCYGSSAGGYHGGAAGSGHGGGGGGGTDINIASSLTSWATRVVVAGGGGGCGDYDGNCSGGTGGGLIGGNGQCGYSAYAGGGGGLTTGGTGAEGSGGTGSFGAGGTGAYDYCGGGGGGWYGGGGGYFYGGGGGGSSYVPTSAIFSLPTPGANPLASGNGQVTINIPPPGGSIAPSCLSFGNEIVTDSSATQSVALNFYNLTGAPLSVAPPAGFMVSLTGAAGTWVAYPGTLNVPYTAGGFVGNIYVKFNPSLYTAYSTSATITGGGIPGSLSFCLSGTGIFQCSGTPTGGVASVSPSVGGPTSPFTLNVSGILSGSGINYQWQSSPYPTFGFTNIPGATTAAYNFTGITANTYYQCALTCSASGLSANTTVTEAVDTVISVLTACTGTPTPGTIVADVTSACSAFTSNMGYSNPTSSTTSGLLYQWQSSTDGVTWAAISGATNLYYSALVSSAPIYYDVNITCANTGYAINSPTETLSFRTVPSAITPSGPICMPTPNALTATPSGGVWSSSNTSVATITAGGYASGVTNGVTTIKYTLPDGCSSSVPLTVATAPVSIVGPSSVCAGSTTTAFIDGSAGGHWSSSNPSIASIGSTTGIASGSSVITGPVTIAYTLPSGCAITTPFTVNPLPSAIAGPNHVCNGSAITLTDASAGGTWAAAVTGGTPIFTVGASSGVVTSLRVGGPLSVVYTLPTGCSISMPVTVNAIPNVPGYSVAPNVCVGSSTALTESSSGGTWSSSNTSLATVNSSGVVNGVAAGTTNINYTISATGCSAALSFQVNALPPVNNVTVTNGGYFCSGNPGVHLGLNGSSTGVNYDLWFEGTDLTGPVAGSASALDFGVDSVAGSYIVVATNGTTGCSDTMSGSGTVYPANPLPTMYTVGGGGTYCAGTGGADVNMGGSDLGVSYQLFNNSIPVGSPVAGTGSLSLDFGNQAAVGTYTVSAVNTTTGCVNYMSGSATVNPPTAINNYPVTGGGNYCTGSGTGADVQLANSDIGVTYTLYNAGVAGPSITSVSGGPVDFGNQLAGVYTVRASLTSCNQNMPGSATVGTLALPAVYSITGGGNYCLGSAGTHIGLSYSTTGINYTLYNSTGSVATVAGSFSGLDFGLVTGVDNYFAVATNPLTGCSDTMTGITPVGINPLPAPQTISSGGSFCAGGAGVDVNLSSSESGVNYQLYYDGHLVGAPRAGSTGSVVDFGNQVDSGNYTVVATNPSTTCNSLMPGSAVISIIQLPIAYNVTGGGNYCYGGSGSVVSLNNSQAGVTYSVIYGGGSVGSMLGTGGSIGLGSYTNLGNYTVMGTISGCSSNMNGSVNIGTNPLPGRYNVTGGGNYCSGASGVHVGLSVSNVGINYQLLIGGAAYGLPVAGSGFTYDFGLKTTAGTYQVVATNAVTGCTDTMNGSVNVGINPLPTAYGVINGGAYCAGGTGRDVSINNSRATVKYQLYEGSTLVGTDYGSGSALSFGLQTTPGLYTVVATDTSTGCTAHMTGSASIVVESAPMPYSVTGGGNLCASATTGLPISLGGSVSGTKYYLYDGVTVVDSASGTGSSISFPSQLGGGNYTVQGVNTGTGCAGSMTGTATINVIATVTPGVTVTTPTGSDTVCAGGAVTFTGATTNGGSTPNYMWTVNGVPMSSHTATMSYIPASGDVVSVTMVSSAECPFPATANNSQPITVTGEQVPSVAITSAQGADICNGTVVTLTASPVNGGSDPGYAWKVNGHPVGSASTYSYVPNNGDVVFCVLTSNAPCRTANTVNSTTDIIFNVTDPVAPVFSITADPGVSINKGNQVTFTANILNSAAITAGSYSWKVNSVTQASTDYYFQTSSLHNNDTVSCTVTNLSNTACGAIAATNSVVMSVSDLGVTTLKGASNDVVIVPNPNNGSFNVKGTLATSATQPVTLEVTNMLGQVVYSGQVTAVDGVINSNVQLNGTLASGMYILNVHAEGGNSMFHFVIE